MNAQERACRKYDDRPTGRGDSGLELANSISLDRAAISLSRLLERVNMAIVATLPAFLLLPPAIGITPLFTLFGGAWFLAINNHFQMACYGDSGSFNMVPLWRPVRLQRNFDMKHSAGTTLVLRSPDIRILADTHFRDARIPGEAERRDRFIRFLDGLPSNCVLFLLGDIFDFYFEYRSVVSRRYLDEVFSTELGVVIHERDILVEAQGRRILLAHGDLVMPRDYGYKLLKGVIRNKFVIGLARAIHPDLLDAIAGGVSHGSRTYLTMPQEKRARIVLACAAPGATNVGVAKIVNRLRILTPYRRPKLALAQFRCR